MPSPLNRTITDSLRLMLRPLVRFSVRRGVKLQEFVETLKAVFIEIATEEIAYDGDTPSSSRLSVMTGVHRRDVTRINKSGKSHTQTPTIVSKIVGQWQSDRKFITRDRKPRLLSFEGTESEFFHLVHSVSSDLNPYTVLFELERIGIVKRTDRGLQLCANMFVIKGNLREALTLLAADTEDLYLAVEENIKRNGTDPNLHIKTEYDNIILNKLPEIRAWLVKRGSEFQREVREYLSQFDRDINHNLSSETGGGRVAVGCFSISQSVNPEKERALPRKT